MISSTSHMHVCNLSRPEAAVFPFYLQGVIWGGTLLHGVPT